MKKLENPFPTSGYHGAAYFCDRKEELEQLIAKFRNGNSTTLMSIRRIGKTALIQHLLEHLPEGWKGIYLDILETENLDQFLNMLTTAILRAVPEKSNTGEKFWNFIKSLRPTLSFDSLTGEPKVSFDLRQSEVETNIHQVFQFLETQESKILVSIDEFQQIMKYPESNTDAWLRARIQQLKNVVFIFSGSQQHLMSELFASPKRPFYRSTQIVKLEKIKPDIYRDFIVRMFTDHHKEISPAIAGEILDWTNDHTFYVQQLCNRVFAATSQKVTDDLWKHQAFQLLKEQETVFFGYRNMLTNLQWMLLKAIANEGKVYMPTAKKFLTDYHLGTSASALRSLHTLLEYELVYSEFDENGSKYYSVYDVLFQRWIRNRY